jgi:hypothetical protein
VPHPELAAEQAYVDNAYEQLDRMRSTVARTQEAMATEWAALSMEAWAKRRMQTFEDAERGLVFGRLSLDGTPRPPPSPHSAGRRANVAPPFAD